MNTDIKIDAMREIAVFAQQNCRYYRDLYCRSGVDSQFAELPRGLPLASPQDLAEIPLDFHSNAKPYKIVGSSGTTGNPKLLFRTEEDFERSVANQVEIMRWCGVGEGNIVGIPQPFGFWGYGELTQEATRQLGGISVPVGSISDDSALEIMARANVDVLDVSPSRLRRFLDIQADVAPGFCPKIIMLSGEPIAPVLRKRVKEKWGAAVFEQYGSEETDALGGAMEPDGDIHLLHRDFLFEVLGEDGSPVLLGQSGQLVVTSLYHAGTPLIRYHLGDCVELLSEDVIRVLGRSDERLILFDSVKLFPFQIDSAITRAGVDCEQWQCHAFGKLGKTILKVLLALPKSGNERSGDDIKHSVRRALERSSIDIEQLVADDAIEFCPEFDASAFQTSPRGKTRRFVDFREQMGGRDGLSP